MKHLHEQSFPALVTHAITRHFYNFSCHIQVSFHSFVIKCVLRESFPIGGVIMKPRQRTVWPHSRPRVRGLPFALSWSFAATGGQQGYGERRESPTSLKVTQLKIAAESESIPIAVISDMCYRESIWAFFGWISATNRRGWRLVCFRIRLHTWSTWQWPLPDTLVFSNEGMSEKVELVA